MSITIIASDSHCGCVVGLTPPDWWQGSAFKYSDVQVRLWKEFDGILNQVHKEWGTPDRVIWNGDLIHGKEGRQGNVGVITADVDEQADMSLASINYMAIPEVYIISGTEYHTDVEGQRIEERIAKDLQAEMFGNRIFPVIDGFQFDIRHYMPTSTLPASRPRILAAQWERARDWHLEGIQPLPDILIRSHGHYWSKTEGTTAKGDWIAFSTPGLQGLGSNFGERKCDGVIHFGLVVLKTEEGSAWCKPYIRRPQTIGNLT